MALYVVGKVAVASSLAGLTFQQTMLFFQRTNHVFQPFEIGLRRAQTQFGLVPAGVQTGDAGGFLQQAPALGRLGVDDGTDTALTDHRRRPRTGRCIGEQGLKHARAHPCR